MVLKDIDELRRINDEELYRPHPLTPYQIKVLDNQLASVHSTMWNVPLGIKLKADVVDPQQFLEAATRVIEAHPVLNTRIFVDVDGTFKQQICPGFAKCQLKHVSEQEMKDIIGQYPKPFDLINSHLSLVDIYATEENVYVFIDAHHIIYDGSTARVVFTELVSLYEDLDCSMEDDLFPGFSVLEQRYLETEECQADRAYYEETYGGCSWCNMPEPDFPLEDVTAGNYRLSMGVSIDEMKEAERRCHTTRARLANAAGLLALAKHAGQKDVMITWIFHNRSEKWKANMVGMLIRELPIGIHISELDTLDDLYKSMNKQMKESTKRCSYQYMVNHEEALINDSMEVNYKGSGIRFENALPCLGDLGQGAEMLSLDELIDESEARMEIDVFEAPEAEPDEQIYISALYIASLYKEETIKGFFELYRTMFQRLVKAEKTMTIAELMAD
ncbi:MAG: condensation domain-containing protein [Selenomonadaceae bacterium]|nr:condensation domain-containing protein [Selenomonadaceae bacterium]